MLLIIGNGFDLNLGLKTSYNDFINSNYFLDILSSNYLAKYLIDKKGLNNWIDIENEFCNYSNETSYIQDSRENFEKDYIQIKHQLVEYLKSIEYKDIKKDSYSYKLLEEIKESQKVTILNFNYTNSIETIFKQNNWELNSKIINIIYCHGTIQNDDIIFGVEDSAKIKREHMFLKKSCDIKYPSINVEEHLNREYKIFFIGHSLGKSDYSYFNHFLYDISSNYNNKEILFTYYGNDFNKLTMELDELTLGNVSKLRCNNKVIFKDIKATN